jgi:hypothetical protein
MKSENYIYIRITILAVTSLNSKEMSVFKRRVQDQIIMAEIKFCFGENI